jgi:hypothetical protein
MRTSDGTVRLDIAGTVVGVVGLRGAALRWTRRRYRPFLSTRRPAVTIAVTAARRRAPIGGAPRLRWSDERFALTIGRARAEGTVPAGPVRLVMPAAVSPMNPTIVRLLTGFLLCRHDRLLLHASGVVDRGRAWLFSGPSGSGKTTIARLAGARRVLNDDTVAIRPSRGGFAACATPFFGDGGPAMAARNVAAPLAAVFFLEKADRFAHRRLSAREAIARAVPEAFVPKHDPATVERLLAMLAALVDRVPCYALAFAPRPELWRYVDGIA